MYKISIYDTTGERAVLDSDGDIIFHKILSAFEENECVELDFSNVTTILSIFTNSAIGQLYRKYNSDFLNNHLKITNMSTEDMLSLKRVNERAKQFYSSPSDATEFLKGDVFIETDNN